MQNRLVSLMIKLKNLIQLSAGDSENAKPSYFSRTHYALPTQEQILLFSNFPNLSAKEIYMGIGYTIVGKGMSTGKTKSQELEACQLLIDAYPERQLFKDAYLILNNQQPRVK